MKSSKELEEILLQRKRILFALKKKVADEDPYLRGKQLGIFFRALKGIEKQHNGIDKKIIAAIELLDAIEIELEEIKI